MSKHKGFKCRIVFSPSYSTLTSSASFSPIVFRQTLWRDMLLKGIARLSVLHNIYTDDHHNAAFFSFESPLKEYKKEKKEKKKEEEEEGAGTHKRSGTKETSCNILLFYDDDNKYIGITLRRPATSLIFLLFFNVFSIFFLLNSPPMRAHIMII